MGSAIATRLIQTGAEVTVFDAFAGKLGPLVSIGATAAESAATATRNADFVITSLNSAAIVEKAVFGPNGIAAEGSTDKLLIDMSSIDAGRTSEMAARLREQSGMGWVDAPLSGGAPAALQGTLTLMVGGTEQDVKHAEPLLAQLAARFTRFGEAGAGQTVKLINQVLCAAGFMPIYNWTFLRCGLYRSTRARMYDEIGTCRRKARGALSGAECDVWILARFAGTDKGCV